MKKLEKIIDLNDFEAVLVDSGRVKIERMKDYEDEYVYDCETEDSSHMFTANRILVHNSLYVRMDPIMKHLFGNRKPDWDNEEDFQKILWYVDGEFQHDINKYCADFLCEKFKTPERRIEFKREKISEKGEYLAKKRYIVKVRDSEGHRCNKFSYTGVDIKKNELPKVLKDMMGKCVESLITYDWNDDRFQEEIRRIWEEYKKLSVQDLSYIKNLNTPKDATGFLTIEKGAGIHCKAAQYYNQICEEMKIMHKYEPIKTSDRFHYFYTKTTNKYGIEVIGYKDRYPAEFEQLFEPDLEKMFDKCVLHPLAQIMVNHAFSSFNPNCEVILGKSGNIFD